MQGQRQKFFLVGGKFAQNDTNISSVFVSSDMSSVLTLSQRKEMSSHTTNKSSVFVSGDIRSPKKSNVLTLKKLRQKLIS